MPLDSEWKGLFATGILHTASTGWYYCCVALQNMRLESLSMKRVPAIVMAIVIAASCIPWLLHQGFFSVLLGITAVALFGLMVFASFQALSAWMVRWQSTPSRSRWRLLISRKRLYGWVFVLSLIPTVPHFMAVCGGDYKLAVTTAHQSPQFNDLLGAPVKEGWFSEGEGTLGRGTAEVPVRSEILIHVRGTKQGGNLRVQAVKIDGVWKLKELILELDKSGTPIDLLAR